MILLWTKRGHVAHSAPGAHTPLPCRRRRAASLRDWRATTARTYHSPNNARHCHSSPHTCHSHCLSCLPFCLLTSMKYFINNQHLLQCTLTHHLLLSYYLCTWDVGWRAPSWWRISGGWNNMAISHRAALPHRALLAAAMPTGGALHCLWRMTRRRRPSQRSCRTLPPTPPTALKEESSMSGGSHGSNAKPQAHPAIHTPYSIRAARTPRERQALRTTLARTRGTPLMGRTYIHLQGK